MYYFDLTYSKTNSYTLNSTRAPQRHFRSNFNDNASGNCLTKDKHTLICITFTSPSCFGIFEEYNEYNLSIKVHSQNLKNMSIWHYNKQAYV